MSRERCGLLFDGVTACVRPLAHNGSCSDSWHGYERCRAYMPLARDFCWRLADHGGGHKTRYALENRLWRAA